MRNRSQKKVSAQQAYYNGRICERTHDVVVCRGRFTPKRQLSQLFAGQFAVKQRNCRAKCKLPCKSPGPTERDPGSYMTFLVKIVPSVKVFPLILSPLSTNLG